MDHTIFESGEPLDAFIEALGDARNKFDVLLEESQPDQELLETLKSLPDGLKVMVIAEPWSGDTLYNLPVLVQMTAVKGWDVRVFRRDGHPELMQQYLKDGLYKSIPVFVFYDKNFKEIGHWIERPAKATQTIEEESLKLRRRLREENRADWRDEAYRELIAMLKQ